MQQNAQSKYRRENTPVVSINLASTWDFSEIKNCFSGKIMGASNYAYDQFLS
jgi:hypothetical protein